MPKQFFKRISDASHAIKEHKHLQFFGNVLHDENLWHINRVSISRAFAIGIFTAFLPIPFQMVVAAAFAIFFRGNLPISVSLVWITNPLTMPPIFYFTYKIGARLLGIQSQHISTDFSLSWLATELEHIWKPLFLGSILSGIVCAFIGYITIRIIWRIRVSNMWNQRRIARLKRKK